MLTSQHRHIRINIKSLYNHLRFINGRLFRSSSHHRLDSTTLHQFERHHIILFIPSSSLGKLIITSSFIFDFASSFGSSSSFLVQWFRYFLGNVTIFSSPWYPSFFDITCHSVWHKTSLLSYISFFLHLRCLAKTASSSATSFDRLLFVFVFKHAAFVSSSFSGTQCFDNKNQFVGLQMNIWLQFLPLRITSSLLLFFLFSLFLSSTLYTSIGSRSGSLLRHLDAVANVRVVFALGDQQWEVPLRGSGVRLRCSDLHHGSDSRLHCSAPHCG